MRFSKDLLFTDKYLIKAHAVTGGQRLSTFLNGSGRRFLEVEEPLLIGYSSGDRNQAERAMVRTSDILFAYEMEDTGDEGLKNLARKDKAELAVQIQLGSCIPIHLSGLVRRRVLDSDTRSRQDFIVLINPVFNKFTPPSAPEFDAVLTAPYLIINRNRISLILL